jgi:hypothetical protein
MSGIANWKWIHKRGWQGRFGSFKTASALGVQRYNPGSKRLQLRNSAKGAVAIRGVALSSEGMKRRRRTALELGLRPPNGYGGFRPWNAKEMALLGTMSDRSAMDREG